MYCPYSYSIWSCGEVFVLLYLSSLHPCTRREVFALPVHLFLLLALWLIYGWQLMSYSLFVAMEGLCKHLVFLPVGVAVSSITLRDKEWNEIPVQRNTWSNTQIPVPCFVFYPANALQCYQSGLCFGELPVSGGRTPILLRGNWLHSSRWLPASFTENGRGSLFTRTDSLITNHLIDLMSARCLLITVLIPSVNLCCD